MATATMHDFELGEAIRAVKSGAAFVDLRPAPVYLDVHIPGSLCLHYESGPGMAGRARDCIPLEVQMIIIDEGHGHLRNAAASLRGKGFTVLGVMKDALSAWGTKHGPPASTEVLHAPAPGDLVLDVRDPGAKQYQDATLMPVERLWPQIDSIAQDRRVAVLAGAGVRAALAVGILERHGHDAALFRP